MPETTMPAAEAEAVVSSQDESNSYELAFHVLPTVAEGEVTGVFQSLKDIVTNAEGTLFDEEAPQRFDLAYEVVKYLEGKNRKFKSAYFGWIRFKAESSQIAKIHDEIEHKSEILRFLIIKLTKVEEENPFNFHETIKDLQVSPITDDEDSSENESEEENNEEDAREQKGGNEGETSVEQIDEEELDEALQKPEA